MTNLQEDLTLALQRRAEAVRVENHLDLILDDHNIIRFSNDGRDPRRSRGLLVAAGVAVLVGTGGLIWAANARTQPPAATSTAPAPLDTSPESASASTPGITPGTIPAEFPSDVPRPDTFDLMTIITTDNEPVGWEFYDQREPTDSVERCAQYASSFDASWTPTPKTDEHESVLYAQILDNGQWQVGIYCINDGSYLVQVIPAGAILPLTADTLPPIAEDSSIAASLEPSTAPSVATSSSDAPAAGVRIARLALGDLVMLGAANDLADSGFAVDAAESRAFINGLDTIEILNAEDRLGDVVVIHLGTNGPISDTDMTQMMDALKDVAQVLLVTIDMPRDWTADNNSLIYDTAAAYPNVSLLDWAGLNDACPGDCFYSDGFHLRPDGQAYYANLINSAIDNN